MTYAPLFSFAAEYTTRVLLSQGCYHESGTLSELTVIANTTSANITIAMCVEECTNYTVAGLRVRSKLSFLNVILSEFMHFFRKWRLTIFFYVLMQRTCYFANTVVISLITYSLYLVRHKICNCLIKELDRLSSCSIVVATLML